MSSNQTSASPIYGPTGSTVIGGSQLGTAFIYIGSMFGVLLLALLACYFYKKPKITRIKSPTRAQGNSDFEKIQIEILKKDIDVLSNDIETLKKQKEVLEGQKKDLESWVAVTLKDCAQEDKEKEYAKILTSLKGSLDTLSNMDNSRNCILCSSATREIVFLDCGHVVACQTCANKLQKCPIDNSFIVSQKKLIFS